MLDPPPIIGHCFLVGVAFRVEEMLPLPMVTVANAITKALMLSVLD